jgi:hypothetical protein
MESDRTQGLGKSYTSTRCKKEVTTIKCDQVWRSWKKFLGLSEKNVFRIFVPY